MVQFQVQWQLKCTIRCSMAMQFNVHHALNWHLKQHHVKHMFTRNRTNMEQCHAVVGKLHHAGASCVCVCVKIAPSRCMVHETLWVHHKLHPRIAVVEFLAQLSCNCTCNCTTLAARRQPSTFYVLCTFLADPVNSKIVESCHGVVRLFGNKHAPI